MVFNSISIQQYSIDFKATFYNESTLSNIVIEPEKLKDIKLYISASIGWTNCVMLSLISSGSFSFFFFVFFFLLKINMNRDILGWFFIWLIVINSCNYSLIVEVMPYGNRRLKFHKRSYLPGIQNVIILKLYLQIFITLVNL